MFGKRSDARPRTTTCSATARSPDGAGSSRASGAGEECTDLAAYGSGARLQPAAPVEARSRKARKRSKQFGGDAPLGRILHIKTTIFNALIDAIDLTQLAQLDRDSARDEIRDIVNEIIAIKDVVMRSPSRKICSRISATTCWATVRWNRLLARDDIADIMVNGADTTYIEVDGKVQDTRSVSATTTSF